MPIYEYVCDDCQARYERIVLSRNQAITCPKCGSSRHTLQLSVFSVARSSSPKSKGSPAAPGCACNPSGCGCK